MSKSMPAIAPDHPLSGMDAIAKDKLQRSGFAQAAVAALQRVSTTAGFVLSIEGPWGSGKTSTLSMMEQLIRTTAPEKAVIVHFNPWLVGDRDALLRQFLVAIASALELADHVGNAKKVAKELKNYASVFDFVKWVPGAEPWASIIKGVMKSAGGAMAGVAEQKERDIESQKERLEQALRKFDRKIFVFIDDIDRLFPTEVFEMVRIIKAVGHLPSIGYIVAWDSEYVRRALRSAEVPLASTYIDKIVQIRLPLPAISADSRVKLLNEAIASLPGDALVQRFPRQEERIESLYFNGLRELLEQPRDIVRVVNTLSVIEPGLRGEIVFADILGLACLMVRAPRVYDELRRNSPLFTGSGHELGVDKEGAKSKRQRELSELYAKTSNAAAVCKLVQFLFPSTAAAAGKYSPRQVDVEGHIGAASRLNIALGMAIGSTDVSLVDAKRFLLNPSERLTVQARVNSANGLGFLEMLGDVASTLSSSEVVDIGELCLAVARLVDTDALSGIERQGMMFMIPTEVLALKAVGKLVASVAPNQAQSVAFSIVTDPASLTMAAEILSEGLRAQQEPEAIVCAPSRVKAAVSQLVKNAVAAIQQGTFWDIANPSRLLWTIMRVAPAGAKDIFREIRKVDPDLDRFALVFLRHAFSSNGGQSYALPSDQAVENLVRVSYLKRHAERRLKDPNLGYPLRAAWQAVVDGKALYGKDGSDARM